MHEELYELKEMLMEEVKKIAKKGELTAGSLETVDKLLNSIKNACKITMYEEYSEGEDYSQEGGMSYGGNSYARQNRDSRGRYSREGGYSNARGGRGGGGSRGGRGGGGSSRAGGYSYGDDSEEKVELLREMMQEAGSEEERRTLQKLIRRMEQE